MKALITANFFIGVLTVLLLVGLIVNMAQQIKNEPPVPVLPALPARHSNDYQMSVTPDSLYLWDGDRFVGAISWRSSKDSCGLDSLLLKDNE